MSDATETVGEGGHAFANAERGEHSLRIGGKSYRLRPSYAAIKAAEEKTGQSLLALIRKGQFGDIPLEKLGAIAAEFIRAGAEDDLTKGVNGERIAELIYEEGVPHVMARITVVLLDAASGGRTASGELKPVAEKAER